MTQSTAAPAPAATLSPVTQVGATQAPPAVANAAPAPAPVAQSAHRQIGFAQGLEGWDVNITGGSPEGRGSVRPGSAILTEGDSFLVELQQSFVVPANPAPLSFLYTDLHFDTSDPGSINDAFEASLVDDAGRNLVHPFAPGRDAFFNVTEEAGLATGPGVSGSGAATRTVTVDLSAVPAGTEATLRFRLVNNDNDNGTTVRILDVLAPTDAPPEVTVALENDTAPTGPGSEPYTADLLTNDPTVVGTVSDDQGISRLEARIDGAAFQDVTASLSNGSFDGGNSPEGPMLPLRAPLPPGQARRLVRAAV